MGVWISLCNLCVLGVSVVIFLNKFIYHRDTEDTEVAQRRTQIRPLSRMGVSGRLKSVKHAHDFINLHIAITLLAH